MSATVKPENEAFLRQLVAEGRYPSVDAALNAAIDALRKEEADLSWAKPYLEKGLASLDAGQGIPLDDAFGAVRAHMAVN